MSVLRSKLNWRASGSNPPKKRPWLNWRRALAKYRKRYPEAVRSLTEEEEKTFTFYDFPERMHRHIRTTNAIELKLRSGLNISGRDSVSRPI